MKEKQIKFCARCKKVTDWVSNRHFCKHCEDMTDYLEEEEQAMRFHEKADARRLRDE